MAYEFTLTSKDGETFTSLRRVYSHPMRLTGIRHNMVARPVNYLRGAGTRGAAAPPFETYRGQTCLFDPLPFSNNRVLFRLSSNSITTIKQCLDADRRSGHS
jgi:hypothetical protein